MEFGERVAYAFRDGAPVQRLMLKLDDGVDVSREHCRDPLVFFAPLVKES